MKPRTPNDSGISLEGAAVRAAVMAARQGAVASPTDLPPLAVDAGNLSPAEWGMIAFLTSEVALFSTLIVTYLNFVGQDVVGPKPDEALAMPLVIVNTICLLSSSLTIHLAVKRFRPGAQAWFAVWLGATIVLGAAFLLGTAWEWRDLIQRHHLTLSRNLFGTTYYTLVGFHGLHVTIGLVVLSLVLGLAIGRKLSAPARPAVELVSWYWHFVDVVWVAVFTVVYLVAR